MKRKNITFIGLNYAPEDTAIGLYSTQWVNFLKDSGFNVSVITAFPYYPQWKIDASYKDKPTFLREEIEGVDVFRYKQYVPSNPTFFKRIIHLSDFTLGSLKNLYKIKKCDIVITVVPFTSSVLLGLIQKKRFKNSKLWVHIQDFEFDAALQTGMGQKKNIIFTMLFKLEKWLFSKSDIASTISQKMLERLSKKTSSEQFFLPNWIDGNHINPDRFIRHNYLKSEKVKILYSGNIGDKQDWKVFVKFCSDIRTKSFEIVVVGDGSQKDWLIESIEQFDNVTYFPPVTYEELPNLLCSADIHILFQKIDVIDTVMPSKVLGMMASAKPSIIIGNNKSEVKQILEAAKGGFYYTEYNEKIVFDLERLSERKEELSVMGSNAREFVIENFSKDKILSKFINKLRNL